MSYFVLVAGASLEASIQMSSLSGSFEQASSMIFLASYILPSYSSSLAAASHPAVLVGLFLVIYRYNSLALLTSLISVSDVTFIESSAVRYPDLLTAVTLPTVSLALSSELVSSLPLN